MIKTFFLYQGEGDKRKYSRYPQKYFYPEILSFNPIRNMCLPGNSPWNNNNNDDDESTGNKSKKYMPPIMPYAPHAPHRKVSVCK